jgi:peptidoglycan hydrolase-like protein with peptidoglycan-binding domain
MPGESARIARLEQTLDAVFERRQATPADVPPPAGPGPAGPVPIQPAEQGEPLSGWARLGQRKLFFEGQEGGDVRHLQRQLARFGFLPSGQDTGRFDQVTKDALRAFQHDFGIYVDGVAGSVTAKVFRFLETIDYHADGLPVSEDTKILIQRVARSQQLGIALVGAPTPRGDTAANGRGVIVRAVTDELVTLLNASTTWQGADIPPSHTPERAAQLADSIDAELVVYLDVIDDTGTGAGIATYYFGTATSDSAIGRPLAECIHDEIVRRTGVADRGCIGEDSRILQQPKAPTVRIELGNLAAAQDRSRLADPDHLRNLAAGMMSGVSRLYALDLPDHPVGANQGHGTAP